jgi:phage terminase large subunit-like protein
MGEVVEEAEGALWNRDMIAAAQWPVGKPLPDMRRIVVAIDPAITAARQAAVRTIKASSDLGQWCDGNDVQCRGA